MIEGRIHFGTPCKSCLNHNTLIFLFADNLPESLLNPFNIISDQKVSLGVKKKPPGPSEILKKKLTTALFLIPNSVKHTVNGQTRRHTSCMSKIYLNLFIRGFFWLLMNQSIWTLIDLFWAGCWVYNFSPSVKCFYQLKFTPLLITMHQLESLIPNLLSLSDLYQELRCGGSFPDWIKYLEATKHLAMNQHK